MNELNFDSSPKEEFLFAAMDLYGSGLIATIIEAHGISAEDRYGRTGHKAPGSAEAQAALDLCASRNQFLKEWWRAYGSYEESPPTTHQWAGGWESPLYSAGWPFEKFPQLLAAAKRARVDAVGPAAAQEEEAQVAAKRRPEDQTKLDGTDAAVLGALLAVLRGEVKDARNEPVKYESEAQLVQVLVELRTIGKMNYPGLSESTIHRKFIPAKKLFPLNGDFKVGL